MKKKKLWHIFIILYVLIAVFITLCLLMYNEYNVTEFGNKVLVMVKSDSTGEFSKGDLIIVTKNKDYDKDDSVFYYVSREKNYFLNYGVLESLNKDSVVIDNDVMNILKSTDVSVLTPIEALNILDDLCKRVKEI